MPPGWSKIVSNRTHYVVFGELHGTVETPRLIGDIACALTAKRQRILVAVELSSTQNAGLQRAWAGPHEGFATSVVREMPEWATRNDGVTSTAMLALLTRLHALHVAGRAVDIVAFNGARDDAQAARLSALPGAEPHEAAQAENIRTAAANGRYDTVLVLTGNAHARKRPITGRGVAYRPMAMQLAAPASIASLFIGTGGGTSWGCQMSGPPPAGPMLRSDLIKCGAFRAGAGVGLVGAPRIVDTRGQAGPTNPDGAYDAMLFVGPITASPPAAAQQ
ncbi:MAG: hypothetical protein K2Y20_02735 [Sphingomonas sp.]|nr:hypothetical protein [Sphingomonas sp.]